MQYMSILPKAGFESHSGVYPDGFIGVREVAKMLGVSVPHVYTILKRDPSFPPKCSLGGRCSLWEERTVRAWSDIRICEAVDAANGHGWRKSNCAAQDRVSIPYPEFGEMIAVQLRIPYPY